MKESTAVQKYNYRMRSSFEKNRMVGSDLSHFAMVRRAATKVRCEASSWMRVTCNETQKGCIKPCPRESRTVVLWENRPSEDLHHRRSLFHDQLTHQQIIMNNTNLVQYRTPRDTCPVLLVTLVFRFSVSYVGPAVSDVDEWNPTPSTFGIVTNESPQSTYKEEQYS